jgi:DNA-binding MarR family transcriptional regulator
MVTSGNVTGLVDRLVKEGLVERRASETDRRAQTVRLTRSGEAAFGEMAPAHLGWVQEMMAGVSRKDLAALYELLGSLKQSSEAAHRAQSADQAAE